MAQWLVDGVTATVSGVITVFLVLILIAFLISQLRHIENLGYKKREREGSRQKLEARAVVGIKPESEFKTVSKPDSEEEELELVAVITAAVASSLNTTADRLVVKSIRRVDHRRRLR